MNDTTETPALRNRLAYALQLSEQHNVPISQRREDGSWTSGIALFTKTANVTNSGMAVGTSPGFVSQNVQKAVKDASLQFVEIIANRSDKELMEASRNGEKKPKKLASVLLLVASTSLVTMARDLAAAMKQRVAKIDEAFKAEYPDLSGLIEAGRLIPVDQAISDLSREEAQIWSQIANCRPGIGPVLNSAYVIDLPNDGSIITSDRFGTLNASREAQKSTSSAPANADNAAPF